MNKFKYQHGASMVEFTIVAPIITLLGLALLQYGMLFFAKNQINHASFMAARAGSMANAKLDVIANTYTKALIPLYGGGRNTAELAESYAKAYADLNLTPNLRIEMLNPTQESFTDWGEDPQIRKKHGGKRAIPNGGLAHRKSSDVKNNSGQNIQDANLLKLKITQGYLPKVPFVNTIYKHYLRWLDPGTDAFYTQIVNAGRIPVVTHVTLHMQSDAIEPDNPVSTPGAGNNGKPTDPGDPPVTTQPPPNCTTVGCSTLPPGGGGNGGPGGGNGGGTDGPDGPGTGGGDGGPVCTG